MLSVTLFILGTLVLAGFLRWREIRHDPIGIGYNAKVAFGRFHVFASTMRERSFWGGCRVFYRFEITEGSERQVAFEEIPVAAGVVPFELVDSRILWLKDESRVRVVCDDVEVWRYHIREPEQVL